MGEILTAVGCSVEATLPKQSTATTWHIRLRAAIRSGVELCQAVDVDPAEFSLAAAEDFPVFAPREYVSRMRRGDAHDPLLRQVLAVQAETQPIGIGLVDPVGDAEAAKLPGLLQKYDRRVLLITTGACAVHCRYCFRRHFPYGDAPTGKAGWQAALEAIRKDDSIDEVILSGGDPLTLADKSLAWLVEQIGGIEHVARIRVHTRVPVVLPQRICPSLLDWVANSARPLYFVLHFNHAAEFDADVTQAVDQLRRAGATLLNQTVLLAGVNDSFEAQRDLCLQLINRHILPYYLHQLDLVRGALHFEVSDERAREITEQLRARLPGYAVPTLVREIAGQPSKTIV